MLLPYNAVMLMIHNELHNVSIRLENEIACKSWLALLEHRMG